ncbi:MAG: DUF3365 domain-containing protein [Pseudomonadales bacterium]
MKRKAILLMIPALSAAFAAQADMRDEARALTQQFAKELKTALQQGVKAGGFANAIEVCNTEAPAIAEKHSQGAWQIGRTSLRLRNPQNAPDDWELSVLRSFETRRAAGEPVEQLEVFAEQDGEFRYMKAIPAGGLCLSCHGASLTPAVAQKLDRLYPQDQAINYRAGDIRGAFTLRHPVR